MNNEFQSLIAKAANGQSLSVDEATQAFNIMMSGEATPSQIGGFLMALRVRGETIEEITGAASIMRAKVLAVKAPKDAIDIVGTGGDGAGTYNVSTCAALVAAGAGLKIAKHGNRALSSKSGAADVLKELGVNIDIGPEKISECIDKAGVGFMFAPAHHAAMQYVGPSRVELGTRTIFNLLGPLSNPAGVKSLVIGVFSSHWVEPLAHVLKNLGAERVWVVHGEGLDELTTAGTTEIASLKDGKVTIFKLTPEEAGLERVKLADLQGGGAKTNAKALKEVLAGDKTPYRDIVLLNTAAGLIVASKAENIKQGIEIAASAIDSGNAQNALDLLVATSNN